MDDMGKWDSYYTGLYNNVGNDLSIALGGEVYPELVGMNFPEKLVELWGEWYLDPKIKYRYMKRFDKLLLRMLPPCADDAGDTELVQDDLKFRRYEEPLVNVAKNVLQLAAAYKEQGNALRNPTLKYKQSANW